MRPRSEVWWIGIALGANLVLAAVILIIAGSGAHGTLLALAATARAAFLWFIAAYTAGSLVALFGPMFLPLKLLGRELGLAFAAALSVHLALVSWLCWIGEAPGIGVFLFFGPVAVLIYVLATLSFGDLHTILGHRRWKLVRVFGMNIILYAFFRDFMKSPLHGGIWHVVEYLPFVAMTITAPLLRLAAGIVRARETKLRSLSARW